MAKDDLTKDPYSAANSTVDLGIALRNQNISLPQESNPPSSSTRIARNSTNEAEETSVNPAEMCKSTIEEWDIEEEEVMESGDASSGLIPSAIQEKVIIDVKGYLSSQRNKRPVISNISDGVEYPKQNTGEDNKDIVSRGLNTERDNRKKLEEERIRTVFIGDAGVHTEEKNIFDLFEKFGSIEEVKLPAKAKKPGQNRYFFVIYKHGRDALAAIDAMDGFDYDGNILRVSLGQRRAFCKRRWEDDDRPDERLDRHGRHASSKRYRTYSDDFDAQLESLLHR